MRSYLTSQGLTLLQNSLQTLPQPPSISLTGVQIGSTAGFVPQPTMITAQNIVLDRGNNPGAVYYTPIHTHEIIITAIVDRTIELIIGNVLFFANNTPFLWLVADTANIKLKNDNVAHFAGEKAYLPLVFRFPYIQRLLNFSANTALNGKWPVFTDLKHLTVVEHTLSDQCVIENCDQYFNQNKPIIAGRNQGHWHATPWIAPVDDKLFSLSGGTTKAGV